MYSKLLFLPSVIAYAFSSALYIVSYSRDEPVFDVGSNGFAKVRPITYTHRHRCKLIFMMYYKII